MSEKSNFDSFQKKARWIWFLTEEAEALKLKPSVEIINLDSLDNYSDNESLSNLFNIHNDDNSSCSIDLNIEPPSSNLFRSSFLQEILISH